MPESPSAVAITTRDDEAKEWLIKAPFQEYYTPTMTAIILARSITSVTAALRQGRLKGVRFPGSRTMYATHEGIVEYLKRREARGKKPRGQPVPIKVAVVHKPRKPRVVTPSPSAQELIDAGALDFLKDLAPTDNGV